MNDVNHLSLSFDSFFPNYLGKTVIANSGSI